MTKTKIQTVHFSVFQHELLRHAAATLGSGNLRQAVALPSGEDLDEWVGKSRQKKSSFFFFVEEILADLYCLFHVVVTLQNGTNLLGYFCTAVNTVDFFNQINMLYGTISEFCTDQTCPIMTASAKYEYKWADGHQVAN